MEKVDILQSELMMLGQEKGLCNSSAIVMVMESEEFPSACSEWFVHRAAAFHQIDEAIYEFLRRVRYRTESVPRILEVARSVVKIIVRLVVNDGLLHPCEIENGGGPVRNANGASGEYLTVSRRRGNHGNAGIKDEPVQIRLPNGVWEEVNAISHSVCGVQQTLGCQWGLEVPEERALLQAILENSFPGCWIPSIEQLQTPCGHEGDDVFATVFQKIVAGKTR